MSKTEVTHLIGRVAFGDSHAEQVQCKQMLDSLPDDSLRQVAQMTLEGYSPGEIAEQLGCVRRTVERKLERIREKWSKAEATSTF